MPVAAMHENDLPETRKYQIRPTREAGNVKLEALPAFARYLPNEEFRFSALAANKRHLLAALDSAKRIHDPRTSE